MASLPRRPPTRRSPPADTATDGRHPLLGPGLPLRLATLVAIATGLAYANSFNGAFILDDHPHIVDNDQIRSLLPLGAWLPGNPRPVVTFTLILNRMIGGLQPAGYHAVNLAIHLAAALVLFGIVHGTLLRPAMAGRFGQAGPWLAMVTALLWALHPLQTQGVTYIIQRAESLMGLFYLLTLYGFIRGVGSARPLAWYAASVLACALGMATKVVILTAPLLVLLYDRVFVERSFAGILRRRGLYYLVLLATLGIIPAVGLARSILSPDPGFPVSVGFGLREIGPWEYLRTQPEVILHYLRLCVWPHPLCLDYEWPVATGGYLFHGAILLLMLASAVVLLRRSPAAGFLAASVFVLLGPSSSFIPVRDLAVEHRMYLPLAGVVGLAVAGGYHLLVRLSGGLPALHRAARGAAALLVLCAALGLGLATHRRNAQYASASGMWRDVLERRPANARAHFGLGAALIEEKKPEEAIAPLEAAVRLAPGGYAALLDLGKALSLVGRLDEAAAKYEAVLRMVPKWALAHNNLGAVRLKQGRADDAISLFRQAIALQPGLWNAHYNLGRARAEQNQTDAAIAAYQEAVRLRPEAAEVHYFLANVLLNVNRVDEAAGHYREAIRHDPQMAEAHLYLGNCLMMRGQPATAVEHFRWADRLRPGDVEASNSLGFGLAALGRLDEAILRYDEALRRDPRHVNALLNRANARRAQGRLDEAIGDYRAAVQAAPANAIAHNLLGAALLDRGDLEGAAAAQQEAVRLDPKFIDAAYELGLVLERQAKFSEAMTVYQEVLRMQPGHEGATWQLNGLIARGVGTQPDSPPAEP